MELWDLYDKNGDPLGRLHRRGDPLPAGTYHLVISVMTCTSDGRILLTLRSAKKHPYPALWEITAGSALAGEDSMTAAKRELYEETGITAEPEFVHRYSSSYGSGSLVDMYILRRDITDDDIKLQPGETEAAKWVTPAEFDEMAAKGEITPPVVRRFEIYRRYIEK